MHLAIFVLYRLVITLFSDDGIYVLLVVYFLCSVHSSFPSLVIHIGIFTGGDTPSVTPARS